MGDVDSGRGYLCWGGRDNTRLSVLSTRFWGEPKTSVKYALLKEQKSEQTGKRRGFIKMRVKKYVSII